ELEVRCRQPLAAADESLGMTDTRGQGAASAEGEREQLLEPGQPARVVVERVRRHGVDQVAAGMLLQVLPDAGQIADDLDAVLLQVCCRAETGKHQEARRVESA